MNEDIHFRVLKVIETNPKITQRALADELGISLGKANYCLKSLAQKGWIKASNFKNSNNIAYLNYIILTKQTF